MKRPLALPTVLAAALFLTGGLPRVSAIEWGGTVYNRTTPTYSGTSQAASFQQEDTLALWLDAELNPRLSLTVQGSYTFTQDRPYLFDVDILKLQGRYPLRNSSVLEFSLGRFQGADFTALLFNDNLDGVQVSWHPARANLSLTVGFLGLELQPVSTVSMSWADRRAELSNDIALAPPRMLEMLQVELPELFGRQTMTTALIAQQDLRKEGILSEGPSGEFSNMGGRLSTEYLGVALRGPLTEALYYDLFGYLGTGRMLSYSAIDVAYRYEWILSGLVGGGVRYFREQWLSSNFELRLLLATGDKDFADSFIEGNRNGLATVFQAISQPELTLLFSPRLGNLVMAEASYSLKPVASLQTILKGIFFLRPTLGPISDPSVDPASSSRYIGTEIDLTARWRLFSDLGLAFTAGAFLPGGAFRTDLREPDFGGRIELSFSY